MNFDALENTQENVVTGAEVTTAPATKDATAEIKTKIISDFKKEIAADQSIATLAGSRSKDIEVVNTLGYGDTGSLVKAPDKVVKGADPKRQLQQVAELVGYIVKNNGTTPLNYLTCEYAQDATGNYVGSEVEKSLAPGEQVALAKKYFAILGSSLELSKDFANGTLVYRNIGKSIDLVLESSFFKFNDDRAVHDDSVKVSISEKIGETVDKNGNPKPTFTVAQPYLATFGFLNNVHVRETKGAAPDLASAAIAAYVRKQLEQSKRGM